MNEAHPWFTFLGVLVWIYNAHWMSRPMKPICIAVAVFQAICFLVQIFVLKASLFQ